MAEDSEVVGDPYWREDQPAETEEIFLVQEALLVGKLEELTREERLWPEPWNSLVVRDTTLSDAERLHYLRGTLKGDAAKLLRNLPVREENFEAAWKLLEDRYDNQRLSVKALMAAIFGLPSLTRESGPDLKDFYYTLCDSVEALAALKRPYDASGDWLVHLVIERLDPQSRREWETQLGKTKTPSTFQQLKDFLEGRVNTVEALEEQRGGPAGKSTKLPGTQRNAKVHQVSKSKGSSDQCSLCGASHFILFCADYKAKGPKERKEVLLAKRLCFNCLGRHRVADCKCDKRCQECQQRHHTSIHEATSIRAPAETSEVSVNLGKSRTKESLPRAAVCFPPVLLATARIVVRSRDGEPRLVRALIDQGSEVSLATEALVQLLRLPRRPSNIHLIGIGNQRKERVRGSIQLEFTPHGGDGSRQITTALVLPRITAYSPQVKQSINVWTHLQGLPLADPDFTAGTQIDVLLGADVYSMILEDGVRKGQEGEPIAQKTTLGWIISGLATTANPDIPRASNGLVTLKCTMEDDLVPMVQRFWEQEEVRVTTTFNAEDQECEDYFATTHQRLPSGRYMVRLPFKETQGLGESRAGAVRMLQRMEAKSSRNTAFKEAYQSFLREYEELRHMSKTDKLCPDGESYYLPHHGVLKENSTTTKLRVVFNGSYATSSGKSLNDLLMVGPNLLPGLLRVLLRWRVHRICLTADIEKMFRQIIMHPDDRRFQRLLWRRQEDEAISDYELNTVTYGLACAPYLAIRTLRQLAQDERSRFPRAAAILERDVYMDDVLTGADGKEEARKIQEELCLLCRAGGFNLRKWVSNSPTLLKELPGEEVPSAVNWEEGTLHTALGVHWNVREDEFRVRVVEDHATPVVTRRTVLSRIARIFDPLGFLAPVTVTAKIFLQSLWLLKIDWDTTLPPAAGREWTQYVADLPSLAEVRVPRWLGLHPRVKHLELHGFADASERAFAAVVYLRVVDDDDHAQAHLITSKTKVAPLQRVTLPRLELCAAALLSRLVTVTKGAMEWDSVPTHLWSDSRIVLDWIRGHPSRWKTYVANRVADIQRELPEARWHHVAGSENPADCASRGLPPNQLPSFDLWWRGPAWLTGPPHWLNDTTNQEEVTDLEARVVSNLATSDKEVAHNYLLNAYSSIQRLLRITAWCLRWTTHRSPRGGRDPCLSPAEVEAARARWIRVIQRQEFREDCHQLLQGTPLTSRSKLLRLTPFLDSQGLLRVGGRLKHAALASWEKHPIILPKEGHFTELLIDEAHRRTLHGGTQLTLAALRQRYWILQGRQRVKAHIHRCVTCLRWRASPGQQLMGNLPAYRVTPARPFLQVGLDYAGPFTLLASRGRGQRTHKGYVAVFVCLTTRAAHLEVVSDYSTEAFLAALRRFTARRGLCSTIHSDRGTNFVGAARELRDNLEPLRSTSEVMQAHLLGDGITWRFNPPAAPHFGGIWEAAVKATKHHLRRVVGDQHLTYEEMTTLLAQIEACLNSRPLQPLSDDPGDVTALTPGHFLI
ncbi:uncharacterized protein LOC143378149, partial [Andrena cerasifolii]|uniref:uncharacterized protein LOC143378149 n=1 Tax=Andrena cerasifolii TaxID=2819439 RepID=UPI004038397E